MNYDVVIIGAGPAGLTAGLFATRAGLSTACFERLGVGGQASLSHDIANYPGFASVSGFELMEKFHTHASSFGMETMYEEVSELTKRNGLFCIRTKSKEYTAKQVIVASGCRAKKLGLSREEELTGRGVSYCASCDGHFFKDKVVAVIGGGDTAFENVDYLSGLAKKIYLINRSEEFRAGDYKLNKAKQYKNLKILTSAKVEELIGTDKIEAIRITEKGKSRKLKLDGLFVAIGQVSHLDFIKLDLDIDDRGYIIVDSDMKTNIDGLYACGDVTKKDFRQVITACGDGAIAGNSCIRGKYAEDK